MHGRVRGKDSGKSEAELSAAKEALQKKAKMYIDLTSLAAKLRKERDYSKKSLDLTGKLLRINPDYYTLWNYRREILIGLYGEQIANIRDEELRLSTDAILKNPKAYGAWWHRCWIIQRFCTDYEAELNLCSEFLNQDQRNFHCWNYRRFVVKQGNFAAQSEFAYSTKKIEQNFSNYSAFHHRSVFINQLEHKSIESMQACLQVEFGIVENAIFTDPFDQSAWWYHRFILHWMKKNILNNKNEAATKEWCIGVLQQQLDIITQLVDFEPTCKWPIDAEVFLLKLLEELEGQFTAARHDQIRQLLQKLIEIDPVRSQRYTETMAQSTCEGKSSF
eukprot:GSChrysophyteH1.ASY1.ANO1.1634.1 assembled CDS